MVGIIGAMDMEVDALAADMQDKSIVEKAGMCFVAGKLSGQDAVVVKSGVGKVNAAICAQVLVDVFNVDTLINTGVAGALDAALNVGDLVVSKDAVHHDIDATGIGIPKGQVPYMSVMSFPAAEKLIELAMEANKKANPEVQTSVGRVVSGDVFVNSRALKEALVSQFDGTCAEMEGAAIAHVAYLNQVPYVILRAISDKADDSADVDFPTFAAKAAVRSTRLVEEMLGMM
ncbi:MAG: 5'-methylthioadenosine/adenosylhomocysteine nucleosidase [Lachnospiraceae bacterium]|nr:5'-methylthioadenosine/adenosylhomocysteine nucleosidase [Candidatus Equihabitans merdae]